MAKFTKVENESKELFYLFWCPGCEYAHFIQVNPAHEPCWNWNGDLEKPTVSPSLRVQGTNLCHSFIREGKIEFLSDCDHKLKGQTVEIPNWDGF